MLSRSRIIIIAGCAVASAVAAWGKKDGAPDRLQPVPADQPIPVNDFFRAPLLEAPKLNRAGTEFAAFITLEGDKRGLLIGDLASGKTKRLGGFGDKDIYRFDWLNDKRLIFSLSTEKIYAEGIFVVDIDSVNDSYPVELYNTTVPVGIPEKQPLLPIVWIQQNAYNEGADGGVLQIDTRRRLDSERDLLPGTRGARRNDYMDHGTKAAVIRSYPRLPSGVPVAFLADRMGELAFGMSVDAGVYTLFRLQDDNWQKCAADLDQVEVVAAGDNAGELVVVGPCQSGKPRALQLLATDSGQLGDTLYQDSHFDCVPVRIYRHPVDRRILGFVYGSRALKSVWLDPRYQSIQTMLENQLHGQIVILLGSDKEEKRFFLSASSDRQPATFYLLDLEKKSLGLIKSSRPWIDPARMQPAQMVDYKTRDGLSVDGLLTLPAGTSKNNPAPLVVLPHGGPWVRDTWEWNPEVQFLASRGYAVFQPNYRGSSGSDWKFPAGDQWAFQKMNEDVTDGVKALFKTGLIDPNRVAIMGSSFGGYLALCGATFEPDLYRCAITIAGVFDWEAMIREVRREDDDPGRSGIYRRNLGDPEKEREKFDAISPLRHVGQIKIPVFVSHGKEDNVVYVGQSKRLIGELKTHGVPYEAFLASGEGHGMARVANQVALYSAIETFLAKHLGPDPSAAPGP